MFILENSYKIEQHFKMYFEIIIKAKVLIAPSVWNSYCKIGTHSFTPGAIGNQFTPEKQQIVMNFDSEKKMLLLGFKINKLSNSIKKLLA